MNERQGCPDLTSLPQEVFSTTKYEENKKATIPKDGDTASEPSHCMDLGCNARVESFEVEDANAMSSGNKWVEALRVSWIIRSATQCHDQTDSHALPAVVEDGSAYYGGLMRADRNSLQTTENLSESAKTTTSVKANSGRLWRKKNIGKSMDDDSLADFDVSEWTPQDSAYGAAIPICGWIPKKLRQLIEATLIGLSIFALVYLVVTTSISVTESAQNHVSNNVSVSGNGVYNSDGGLELDDDRYIEYNNLNNNDDAYYHAYYMVDDGYAATTDDDS